MTQQKVVKSINKILSDNPSSQDYYKAAVFYFEEKNIQVLPIPVEHFNRVGVQPFFDLPNATSLYRSERAIHEYLGIIYQKHIR